MHEKDASLLQNLRALPRGAWLLFLGTFLNKFGTFVIPFLALYMKRLGYTEPQSGLAISAYGLGTLGACLLGGHLADNFGRRQTIVLSMFSSAAAMLCLSQARSLPVILLMAALAGLTGELYRPAGSALLADLVPAGKRVTAFAAYRMSFNAGWAAGPSLAGLMAGRNLWLWLFVGNAASAVVYGLMAWLIFENGAKGTREENSLVETYAVFRHDRRFRQVIFAALAVGLVYVQAFSTMSLAITDGGFSPATYGKVIALNGLLVVIFELLLTNFTKRHAPRRMMALGFVLVGVGFATNLIPRSLPGMLGTVTLFTFGEMIAMPVAGAYVADLAPANKRGLYMGAYMMVWAIAMVVGPSLGMQLYAFSPRVLWIACGAMGLFASALILIEPGRRPTLPETDLTVLSAPSGS